MDAVEQLLAVCPAGHPSEGPLREFLSARQDVHLRVGTAEDEVHMDLRPVRVPAVLPVAGTGVHANSNRVRNVLMQTVAPETMRSAALQQAYNAGVAQVLVSSCGVAGGVSYYRLPKDDPLQPRGSRDQFLARLRLTCVKLEVEPLPCLGQAVAGRKEGQPRLPQPRSPHGLPAWTPKGTLARLCQDSGRGGRPIYAAPLFATLCLELDFIPAASAPGVGMSGVRAVAVAMAAASATRRATVDASSAQLLAAGLVGVSTTVPVLKVHTGRLRVGCIPVLVGSDLCSLRGATAFTRTVAGLPARETGGFFQGAHPLTHDYFPGHAPNFPFIAPGERAGSWEAVVYTSHRPPHDTLSVPSGGTYQLALRLSDTGVLTLSASLFGDEGVPLTLVLRACGAASDTALHAALELPGGANQPGACASRRLEAQCHVARTLAVEREWVAAAFRGAPPCKAVVAAAAVAASQAHRASPFRVFKSDAEPPSVHCSGLTLQQATALATIGKLFADRQLGKPLAEVKVVCGAGAGAGTVAGAAADVDVAFVPGKRKRERELGEDEANTVEEGQETDSDNEDTGREPLPQGELFEGDGDDDNMGEDSEVRVVRGQEEVEAFLRANAELVVSGLFGLWHLFLTCVEAPEAGTPAGPGGVPLGVLDTVGAKGAWLAALGRRLLGVAVQGGPVSVKADATHGVMMGFPEFLGAVLPQNVAHALQVAAKERLGGNPTPTTGMRTPARTSPFGLMLAYSAELVGTGLGSALCTDPVLVDALTTALSKGSAKALAFTSRVEVAFACHQWLVGPAGAPPKQMFMPAGTQNHFHADASLCAYRAVDISVHAKKRSMPGSQHEQRCMNTTPDNENGGLVGETPVGTIMSPVRSAATTPGGARDPSGAPLPLTAAGLRAALRAAGFAVEGPGHASAWTNTAWRLVMDGVPVGVFAGGKPAALGAARALDAARAGCGHPALVALGLGLFSDVGWHVPAQPAFGLPVATPRNWAEPVVHLETVSGRAMQAHIALVDGMVPAGAWPRLAQLEARLAAVRGHDSDWAELRRGAVIQTAEAEARALGHTLPYEGNSFQVCAAARDTPLEQRALRAAAPKLAELLRAAGVVPAWVSADWVPDVVPGWQGAQFDVGPEVRAALTPMATLLSALTGPDAPLVTRGPNSVGWVAQGLVDVAVRAGARAEISVEGGADEKDDDDDDDDDEEPAFVDPEDLPAVYSSAMVDTVVRFGSAASQIPGGLNTTPVRMTYASMQLRQVLVPWYEGYSLGTGLGFSTPLVAPRSLGRYLPGSTPLAWETYAAHKGRLVAAASALVAQGLAAPEVVSAVVAQTRRELLDGAVTAGQVAPGAWAGAPLVVTICQFASTQGLQAADNDAVVIADTNPLGLFGVRTVLQQMSNRPTVSVALDGTVFWEGIALVDPDGGSQDTKPWDTLKRAAPEVAAALLAGDMRVCGSEAAPGLELVVVSAKGGGQDRMPLVCLDVESLPGMVSLPGVVQAGAKARALGLAVSPQLEAALDGGVSWTHVSRCVKVGSDGAPVACREGEARSRHAPPLGVSGLCELVWLQTPAEISALFGEAASTVGSATGGVVDVGAVRAPGGVLAVHTWVRATEGVSLFLPGLQRLLRVVTRATVEYRVVRVHAVRQGSLLTGHGATVTAVTVAQAPSGTQHLVVDMLRRMPTIPGDKFTSQLSQKTVPGPPLPLGDMPFDPLSGAISVVLQDPNAQNTRKVPATLMAMVATGRALAAGLPYLVMTADQRFPQVLGGPPLNCPRVELYPGGPALPEARVPGGLWAGVPTGLCAVASQLPLGAVNTARCVLVPGRTPGVVGGPGFDQQFPGLLAGGGVATMFSTKHLQSTTAKAVPANVGGHTSGKEDQVRQGGMELTAQMNLGVAGTVQVQYRNREMRNLVACKRCGCTDFVQHHEGGIACANGVCRRGAMSVGITNFTVSAVPEKLHDLILCIKGMGLTVAARTEFSDPSLNLQAPIGL